MKITEKVLKFFLFCLSVLISIFALNHQDLEYISVWAVSLLEHIHQGNIENYAIDLFQMEYGTNYNLFQNASVALWCLPLYVLEQVSDMVIPILGYQICIKICITLLHVLCAKELFNVICLIGVTKRKAKIAAWLYLLSPVVMIHGIGIGQIDCIGVLFFLLSIRMLIEKKYWKMSIAIGFALLSKLFVVFIYIPVFLLNFDKAKRAIKYIIVALGIPVFDKVLTSFLIEDYSLQIDVHNSESFFPRLFNVSFGYDSLLLLVVFVFCGLCLLIGNRVKCKPYFNLLFPSAIFWCFLLLVFWHPQWFIYIYPILLMMGCYIGNEYEYSLFYAGLIGGYALHSIVNCNLMYFNAVLVSKSLLGKNIIREQQYIGEWIINNISKYIGNVGYTIFMASYFLLIILYFVSIKERNNNEKVKTVSNIYWSLIAFVPSVVYMVLLLMFYL